MAITAAAVKSLRERTGLPMMDCKKALEEAGGDEDAAIETLRKKGAAKFTERQSRETAFGRIAVHASLKPGVGAMVELKCESAPMTKQEDFVRLADDLAKQLATGPGAATADELLAQPSPSDPSKTLADIRDDAFNRMREVFNVGRMVRIDGPCGGYSHNAGTIAGVLVEAEGGNEELLKDIAMHIAAMRPMALTVEELDPAVVAKEKEILTEASRAEGKPVNIIEKMVIGRMRNFYAERVLLEQPFVKDDKQSVGKVAKAAGAKLKRFVHWILGEQT